MSEKPLNVRVAEALGHAVQLVGLYGCSCSRVGMPGDGAAFPGVQSRLHDHIEWEYWRPDWDDGGDWHAVERYDSDWRVTGPLIEEFKVYLDPHSKHWEAAAIVGGTTSEAYGDTALVSVCNLLIALAEAGKLPK